MKVRYYLNVLVAQSNGVGTIITILNGSKNKLKRTKFIIIWSHTKNMSVALVTMINKISKVCVH